MFTEILWDREIPYLNPDAETPNTMRVFPVETDVPRPCVVVLPGGGYRARMPHEDEPIARFFNSRGMHAAVVDYRVKPNKFPAPLADAQRGIRILRANAEAWKIDPHRIVACGFSAGGHLAACLMTLFEDYARYGDGLDDISPRPDGGILGYPLIDLGYNVCKDASGDTLFGDDLKYVSEYFSLQNRVTPETPPAFIWHTAEDVLSCNHSLVFAMALRSAGVPFEMHIFPEGKHGMGLAKNHEEVGKWPDMAADFIERHIPRQKSTE